MISKFKSRPRTDSHQTEIRVQRRSWDRAIYLVLLAGFALLLANYLVGDRLLLRADGLVLRDRTVIAATSTVKVADVAIKPGQRVEKDEMLLRAESTAMLDRLADLAMRGADLDERRAALISQSELTKELLPIADARLAQLVSDEGRLSGEGMAGLVTASRQEDAADRLHLARTEVSRLGALSRGLAQEIEAVSRARGHATEAVRRLSAHYADGVQRAPHDGVIDGEVPSEGEVFSPGEPIATLLSGHQYILAYLPNGYLFDLAPGQAVRVAAGKTRVTGRIDEILPVSASIPDEFHNSFRARERRQLARISLPDGNVFPTHSTVRIRSDLDLFGQARRLWAAVRDLLPVAA